MKRTNERHVVVISEEVLHYAMKFTLSLDKKIASLVLHEWLDEILRGIDKEVESPDVKWEKYPEWVNAIAQDKNGVWYGYEEIPYLKDRESTVWTSHRGICNPIMEYGPPPIFTPWRQSLRLRGEAR